MSSTQREKAEAWSSLALLLSVPILVVINGAMLALLWHWFVANQFGVREISIPLAAGLSSIVTFFLVNGNETNKEENPWKAVLGGMLMRAILLVMAFIVHLFL